MLNKIGALKQMFCSSGQGTKNINQINCVRFLDNLHSKLLGRKCIASWVIVHIFKIQQ